MNILIWLAAGLATGYAANFVTASRGRELRLNYAVGMLGALVGGAGLLPLLLGGQADPHRFSPGRTMIAVAVAVILLAAFNLVRGRLARR